MKNFIKFAAVGIAGYLVGFYEMKYKTQNALLKVLTDEKFKTEEDEAQ